MGHQLALALLCTFALAETHTSLACAAEKGAPEGWSLLDNELVSWFDGSVFGEKGLGDEGERMLVECTAVG